MSVYTCYYVYLYLSVSYLFIQCLGVCVCVSVCVCLYDCLYHCAGHASADSLEYALSESCIRMINQHPTHHIYFDHINMKYI